MHGCRKNREETMRRTSILMAILLVVLIVALTGCGGGGGSAPPDVIDPTAHVYTGVYSLNEGYGVVTVKPDGELTFKTKDEYGGTVTFAGTITDSGFMTVAGNDSRGDHLSMSAVFAKDHYGIYTEEINYRYDDEDTTHGVRAFMTFYKQ
jgi:hypothetical protein